MLPNSAVCWTYIYVNPEKRIDKFVYEALPNKYIFAIAFDLQP